MTTASGTDPPARPLSLTEEFILLLLNEETGYFHQVPGWDLNCAVVGAVLSDLSLLDRIDTDLESLFVVSSNATGDAVLDPVLEEISADPARRSVQYWIERLAHRGESIVDSTLASLVAMKVLQWHDGDFYTLARAGARMGTPDGFSEASPTQFIKTRIASEIFDNELPDPRDVFIVCLVNTCDVLRFIYQLDDEAEKRIEFICNMYPIGRAIAEAVTSNLTGPLLRHSALAREIPTAPLRKLLLSPHFRKGNFPAAIADIAEEYGPVFEIRPPFREPLLFLAGAETNRWVHRNGRLHLRARDYLDDFEKIYGAAGVLPALDGADHFRLRKALHGAYSRNRLAGQVDDVYDRARKHMAQWEVGASYQATEMSRRMINDQISPLMVGVDSQDVIDDLLKLKERALTVHVMKLMPRFMLKTPAMKRRMKLLDTLLERIESVHTPAQRAGRHRNLVDDYLSLHASDPQFMPESNLRFAFTVALVASAYLGDGFSFALYAMASQPEYHARIQAEADALFGDGDPDAQDFNPSNIDVTHRFLMECLRMYPVVPISIRNVMNSCIVGDYVLPVGSRVHIAQTASHFMDDVFPDPFKFDIDRYLPPRNEHRSPGYAPYGLGTHTCLGSRWMDLQLTVNLLMVAHYFNIEVSPPDYEFRFSPLPSMKPSKKLRFRIAEQRRELPA